MSTTFEVAHIHEQGNDMIIVFVNPSFGNRPGSTQEQIMADIQHCAHRAGLAGSVVAVWQDGRGGFGFRSPRPWVGFFQSVPWNNLVASVNRSLTCG